MPERIYQHRFGEPPLEVTPKNFKGIKFREIPPLRRFVREVREDVQIKSPADAAQYLRQKVYAPFEQFDQEEMWVLLLNIKYWVTHEVMVYRGTINTTSIREAELFKVAVRVNAPALIVSHVHPSGDPSPSPEDIKVNNRLVAAARMLGIELLDHLIIGRGAFVSLKERK